MSSRKKAHIAIAVIFFVLSFIIALQFKSVTKNGSLQAAQMQRTEDLLKELNKERERILDLNQQLLQANNSLETYRLNAEKSDSGAKALAEELKNAMMLAGMSDVEGPGVTVTLNDSKENVAGAAGIDTSNYIVHDRDLRDIVNELVSSGAEAISINGERITGKSSIRCVGPTVTINGNYHSAPFVIRAIGDPNTLEAGLNIRDGVVDIMRAFKIEVTIAKSQKIQIPKYAGKATFFYAEPVPVQTNIKE